MKLIDADTLLEELKKSCKWHAESSRELSLLQRNINIAKEQPTVDAVRVIRCKDCKHMVEHKGYGYLGESAYTCESNMDGWILPDSYCSMAERKEE